MGAGGRTLDLVSAVARPHEHGPSPGRLSTPDVEPPIAHHHRTARIDVHVAAGLLDHPGTRFAATACLPIALVLRFRMMRTEVVRVDAGVTESQPRIERVVHRAKKWLVDEAPGDRRLVRDDDCGETSAVQQANGVGRPREHVKRIETIEVPAFLDERAVAIEKDRRTHHEVAPEVTRRSTVASTRAGSIPVMHR